MFQSTLWNLRSLDSLQGRKVEHVLHCFFLADILNYEQAKVGSVKATKCKLQRAYAVCRPWRSHCTDAVLTEGGKCCTRVTNWPPTYNRGGIYSDKKNKKQAPMGIPVEQADLECNCSYSIFGTNSISPFQLYSPKEKSVSFWGGMRDFQQ